jgi:hypothetical protein
MKKGHALSQSPSCSTGRGSRAGDPIADKLRACGLPENKYSLGIVCYSLLVHESVQVRIPGKRVAIGSYLLRSCLKWDRALEVDKSEPDFSKALQAFILAISREDPGHVLRRTDRHFLSSTQLRAYMLLESIDMVGEGFMALGYIPGASWMFRRGYDISSILTVSCLPDYRSRFMSRLHALHIAPSTAIPDVTAGNYFSEDYENFDDQNISSQPFGRSHQTHVSRLCSSLALQDILGSASTGSHFDSICDMLEFDPVDGEGVDSLRETVVVFTLDELMHALTLSVREGSFVVFEEVIWESTDSIVKTVLEKYTQLENILAKNKELITTASMGASEYSVPLFWDDRKRVDEELGMFVGQLEEIFFARNKDAVEFLKSLKTPLVNLVLPNLFLGLPFESFPCLIHLNCMRVIAGVMTRDRVKPHTPPSSLFYVVNPGGDCAKTETAIVPSLRSAGWTGHQGSPTLSDKELIAQLRSASVFLFSGHGGGEKHWSGSSIQRIGRGTHRAPRIVHLMGCSSAKPYGDHSAPFCTPFHYLLGGSEFVVGTLWDVLGRELDRVTLGLVETTDLSSAEALGEALSRSKQRAKLEYLSGASFVVYRAI